MHSAIGALLPLLAILGAGYLYVRPLTPSASPCLRLALAHLCGAAALGFGVTLGLVVTNQVSVVWGALGLVSLALAGRFRRSAPPEPGPPSPAPGFTWLERVLLALIALGVVTALARVALLPLDWDGWAIWQFKARAMVDGSLQTLLTSPQYGYAHPDYPLLVPSQTWWLSAGVFQPKLAQCSGFLFFLDLLALLYHWARSLASRRLALVGCAVLVSWPLLMKHTASGFADVPLAAYVLATAVYLGRPDLPLGLVCLAGALLTKNEGLFTLLGALLVALSGSIETPRPGAAKGVPLRVAAVLGTGILAAGVWSVMKRRWALNADLLDPSRWPKDLLAALLHRVPGILRALMGEAVSVGPRYPGWGLFWPVALLLALVSARGRLRTTLPLYLMCGAHLVGIFTAYLVTPLDPALHLSRSLDRLLLHFAPTLLLASLIALRALERRESTPV